MIQNGAYLIQAKISETKLQKMQLIIHFYEKEFNFF